MSGTGNRCFKNVKERKNVSSVDKNEYYFKMRASLKNQSNDDLELQTFPLM